MRLFLFAFLVFIMNISFGQKSDTLTNQTIIQLTKVGLGKDILISKIQSSFCRFDLTTDGLISLKKAAVADEVIGAMMSKSNNVSTSSSERSNNSQSEQVQNNTSLTPGIYYCKGTPCNYQELEASVYSQGKTNANLLMAYGGKSKMKATLSTANANLQIEENKPVFYFYFNQANQKEFGSSDYFGNATSPNEFLLIKFTLSKNKKTREVVTATFGVYSGASSGVDDEYKVPIKYEKVSQGVYKVYLEKPLEKGEYGFMNAAASTSVGDTPAQQKVYDFGVR